MNNYHLGKRMILILGLVILVTIVNLSVQLLLPLQELIMGHKVIYDVIFWITISGAFIIGTLLPIERKYKIIFAIFLPIICGISGVLLSILFIQLFTPCGVNCFHLDFRVYCSNATLADKMLHHLCTDPEWINYSVIIVGAELLINKRRIIIGGIIGGIIGLIIGYTLNILWTQIFGARFYLATIITYILSSIPILFPIIGILLGEKVILANFTKNTST